MNNNIFCLKNTNTMQDLSEEDIMEISDTVEEVSFQPSEIIYSPGESQGKVYFIREGEVDIYQKSISGKTFVVLTLKSGDIFGDLDLSFDRKDSHTNFAKSVTHTKICIVDKVSFVTYLQKKPQVAMRLIEEMSKRLIETESKMRDLALNDVKIRILNELRRLSEDFGDMVDGGVVINKKITHQYLADRISASRETVTKTLKILENNHIVFYTKDGLLGIDTNKINTIL